MLTGSVQRLRRAVRVSATRIGISLANRSTPRLSRDKSALSICTTSGEIHGVGSSSRVGSHSVTGRDSPSTSTSSHCYPAGSDTRRALLRSHARPTSRQTWVGKTGWHKRREVHTEKPTHPERARFPSSSSRELHASGEEGDARLLRSSARQVQDAQVAQLTAGEQGNALLSAIAWNDPPSCNRFTRVDL